MLNILFLEGKSISTATFLPYKQHNIEYQSLTNTIICTGLTEITLPNSVTTLSNREVFEDCNNIDALNPGIYILRQGNAVKKISVK